MNAWSGIPGPSRLVVVSNRVAPITEGQPTAGGLAAGVMDALRQRGGLWFGWSGEIVEGVASASLREQVAGPVTLFTTDLSRADYDAFYRGFANGTLWPVLHGQTGLSRFDRAEFAGYRRVNAQFAHSLAGLVRGNDLIWAHDYHLFCLADALRAEGVRNRMGLFLHTPFPAPQVLMTVPVHVELIRALCQFDVIGFQTAADRTAFRDYVLRHAAGRVLTDDRLLAFGRVVDTGVYPIGVHVDEVRAQALASANLPQAVGLRRSLGDGALVMSVDRLDYSKGLRERFRAYERFLEQRPERRGRATFLQIAPPSRADIETYQAIRRELEAEAGRINGRFAELDWMPIRYLNKGFPRSVLMPLYAEAQVGLVTPLRDGMNLVAKEYVAAQNPENPGVLILSQFAGAACELDAALIVNPFDPAETAEALERALAMPLAERRERHAAMLGVMRRNSLDRWRDRFVADLAAASQTASATPSWPGSAPPSRPFSVTRMPWTEAKPNV
jgi:trehalose 6-phosphate synthase